MRQHLAPHIACFTACLAALALPAVATPTVTLTARESVNYLYYFGGFAISGDEGEAGDPAPVPGGAWAGTPVTGFAQPTLSIRGSDFAPINYLGWSGYLSSEYEGRREPGRGRDQVRRQHALIRSLVQGS